MHGLRTTPYIVMLQCRTDLSNEEITVLLHAHNLEYSVELRKQLGVSRRITFKYLKRVRLGQPPRLANKGGRKPLFTEEEKWQLAQTQTSDFEAAVLDVLELKVTCLYLHCCMHTSHHTHSLTTIYRRLNDQWLPSYRAGVSSAS